MLRPGRERYAGMIWGRNMIGSSDPIDGPAGNLAASGPLRTVLLASAAAVLPLAALSIGPTPATAGTRALANWRQLD